MFFIFSKKSGVVKAIHGIEELKALPEVQLVRQSPVVGARIGGDLEEVFLVNVWAKLNPTESAQAFYERASALVQVEMEE